MIAGDTHDGAVRRKVGERRIHRLEHRLLSERILRMTGGVRALLMDEHERVVGVEPLARELNACAKVSRGVVRFPQFDRLQADRAREPAQERRLRNECAGHSVPLLEAGNIMWTAPPLQRDHVEPLAVEPAHYLTRPFLSGARSTLRLRDERLRAKQRMARAKKRIRVGHAFVCTARYPKHGLAAPDVLQRERHPVELDPVTPLDESLRLFGILFGIRPARQPPAVVAALGGTQSGVREDVLGAHLLAAAERLENCASRKLVRPIAKHRPVRNLARRRAARANRVDHTAGPVRAQSVEIRRTCGLDAGFAPKRFVRAVGDAVQQEDDDRVELQTCARSNEWITRATPGGTSDSQSPPRRIASRTSRPESSFSTPSSRTTTS